MASHSCGLAPEKAVYTIAYNTEKDETDIFLRADREVLSMKTELITCGGKQSLHVITSGEPHPGHGTFEQWGKGHFPSMEESEQLQIWRDKNFKQTMNAICNTPHRTAAGARKCTSKIPAPNWSGYKPHLMRASRPHVNAIWRSGYYSIPFEPNEQGGQLPVPRTTIPSVAKDWARINTYKQDRRQSHSSISSDTSSTLDDKQSSRVPEVPTGHTTHEYPVGKSAKSPIQIHDEPSEGSTINFENGVEAEVSSFSFGLRIPKGVRSTVHDELILRGLSSPLKECRDAANELLLMKQSYRSYTKNQLKRRENKFLDTFRHGRNFPTPQDIEKDLFSPYKPLEKAARTIFMNKHIPDTATTVQLHNKALIDLYKKVQSKINVKQMNLERKEDLVSMKKKGPQITSAVSWDPELWDAVDCEDPYVKMWAGKYHKLLMKKVPSCHPDMQVAAKALHGALKDYKYRVQQEVKKDQKILDELRLTQELKNLYLVQQGDEAARAPEAQLSAQQRAQPEANLARPPSPNPISSTPECTDDDEVPMLVAEAMEDFAPDNMLNKGNLDIPLKQESEQE